MHENPDVISVQPGESSLTSEIFHEDFHHEGILVLKESERKNLVCLISVPRFDIRLIIMFVQVLCLVPFLPYV